MLLAKARLWIGARKAARRAANEDGTAAVEFALLLPNTPLGGAVAVSLAKPSVMMNEALRPTWRVTRIGSMPVGRPEIDSTRERTSCVIASMSAP